MGALLAPTLLPLLPPETYIRYAAFTHLQQPRIENNGWALCRSFSPISSAGRISRLL